MSKIQLVKADHIEFSVFDGAKIWDLFEKQYGKSAFVYVPENPHDVNAFAYLLLLGHKCWSKLTEAEEVVKDCDYILDRMSYLEMVSAIVELLSLKTELVSEDSDKKK